MTLLSSGISSSRTGLLLQFPQEQVLPDLLAKVVELDIKELLRSTIDEIIVEASNMIQPIIFLFSARGTN